MKKEKRECRRPTAEEQHVLEVMTVRLVKPERLNDSIN